MSDTAVTEPTPDLVAEDRQNGAVDEPRAAEPAPDPDQSSPVDLGRIAWIVTSLVCTITAVIVLIKGYYGYAGVTFAVALAAAINLL
jgi:Na+/alanine symporter